MQNLKILNTREKREVMQNLGEMYGFKGELRGVLLFSSKQKYFILSGDMEKIPLEDEKKLRLDKAGLYLGRKTPEGIRLSIEGSQIIGRTARKNVLLIGDEHLEPWVKGQDFVLSKDEKKQVKGREGYFIIRHDSDFLGCARIRQNNVQNLVSKNRRIKTLNI